MKKYTTIVCLFILNACVQIPRSTQQDIIDIKQGILTLKEKTDTNTVNIKKNYQSFLKIIQNATNSNGTYVPLSDDDLLKIINGTTNGKGNKN